MAALLSNKRGNLRLLFVQHKLKHFLTIIRMHSKFEGGIHKFFCSFNFFLILILGKLTTVHYILAIASWHRICVNSRPIWMKFWRIPILLHIVVIIHRWFLMIVLFSRFKLVSLLLFLPVIIVELAVENLQCCSCSSRTIRLYNCLSHKRSIYIY